MSYGYTTIDGSSVFDEEKWRRMGTKIHKKPSNTWRFKVASRTQIDWEKIAADLSYAQPLAFVDVDKDSYVIVHNSLLEKAELVDKRISPHPKVDNYLDKATVYYLEESERSGVVARAKRVKEAQWPEDFRDGGEVVVTVPKV